MTAVALAAVGLSGCASVVKGDSQAIAITTPPTSGAACTLQSPRGSWTVTTPGQLLVERSKEDVQVRCTKPGWQDAVATIPSTFEGWTLGNILIGGIVGVGVDAATGAINEYPHAFQIPMMKAEGAAAAAPAVAPPGGHLSDDDKLFNTLPHS